MKKPLAIIIIFLLFLAALVLNGCSDEPTSLSLPKSDPPVVSFQGFKIPQFPTAQGQLNYAKSGFPNPEEKRAALKILFKFFPEARLQCGNAALGLAYMNLGYDYRFAARQDYYNAIKDYRNVIKNFKEYPQILVKANWYLGWIHCDLLKEKKIGIPYFRHIVKTYPNFQMGISSPVPWVSLVYPVTVTGKQPTKNTTNKQWASLALLEIIRHAPNRNEVFNAFDLLWKNYQNSVPTGLAIKLLLQDERYAQIAMPYIEKYLALNIANPYLEREIRNNAKEY
ncbi:hypothetical protein [Desulfobacula sp.]|uniref:tetratricopeptide repeat protein n=1 Tax=Desulfobacula sp. TaxID=2593537 RepID=UPI0025C16395|nr:hypothetical protein [Desulfobacula sp.]MBC2705283.1 hypothetical protein [Desulfobacula sp.]